MMFAMRNLIVTTLALTLFAAAAHAEQKNVQMLTNMSDYELLRTMNMMRGALGVHCDFCHVVGKDGWEFASDEKKEKKTAREMISMVLKCIAALSPNVPVSGWRVFK